MLNRYDIEDIILGMADIVRENRDLRYEVSRLHSIVKQQNDSFNNMVKESQKADREFLKIILENALMGGNAND